jgi:hypothetical protein
MKALCIPVTPIAVCCNSQINPPGQHKKEETLPETSRSFCSNQGMAVNVKETFF